MFPLRNANKFLLTWNIGALQFPQLEAPLTTAASDANASRPGATRRTVSSCIVIVSPSIFRNFQCM